jgi:hypothetical protein
MFKANKKFSVTPAPKPIKPKPPRKELKFAEGE